MEELLNKIVYHAMLKKATDIHFYCEKCCTIRLRIHGSLERYETLDKSEGLKLMNYLKYISHINMNYQLLPQTGHFQYLCDHKFVYCRVSYLPTTKYESIVMRLLDDSVTFKIDQLSLQNNILEFYHWLLKQKSGLFLISGPTGSGKSTTLYTLLQELAKDEKKNIITIEDPVEINVKGCIQVETNEKLGLDDHIILNQILRHDPDVVMIGEIRDEKTAQLALTCALTGHMVLATIHAGNAIMTLKRLLNLHISSLDVLDVIIGIVSQRLYYEESKQRIIVLSELLTKDHIKEYLQQGRTNYQDFQYAIEELINSGVDAKVFQGELYE